MAYYIRVFCTSDVIPTVEEIIKWARIKGYNLRVDKSYSQIDIKSRLWDEVAILNEDGKRSFVSEVNRDSDTEESLVKEEVEEFIDIIKEIEDASKETKLKVVNHLKATKYIVANQLIEEDMDEEDINASSMFLQYFVVNCGGMVQEDEEGFYEGEELILEME